MKDYSNNQRIAGATSLLLGIMLLVGLAFPAKAAGKLSPGIDIVASDFVMATNGVVGTEIYFSKEDFAASLGVESVKSITVASLPDATLGRLALGNRYVEVGQTVKEADLDDLRFIPFGSDEIAATFGFCVGKNTDGAVYNCTVYTTKKVNVAPTINVSDCLPASGGEISAFSGVTYLGTAFAVDPEGDPLTFEIVSKPLGGTVKLTDKERGYFEYTAAPGFTGKDSFKIRVTDKYGNRSEAEKITLRVEKPQKSEIFSDMEGHYANSALISCIKAGIIAAPEDGELFRPDEYVSRAEFLSLAMKASGYSGFMAYSTGFFDDADIPEEYKGCIAAAEAFGIIDGIETAEGLRFYPNNQITKAEAAVILSRISGISDETLAVFADSSVPTFARAAMGGMYRAGIIRGNGEELDVYAAVTRGAAVQMINSCMEKSA